MAEQNENIVTGKTESGFEYSVDTRKISDIRTLRKIGSMFDTGLSEPQQVCRALDAYEMILGKEQVEALENHIRLRNDGYCSYEAIEKEVAEIVKEANQVKN